MKPGDPAAVEQLFDAVAPRYDRLNDVLSFLLSPVEASVGARPQAESRLALAGSVLRNGGPGLELGRCVRPAGAVTASMPPLLPWSAPAVSASSPGCR